MKGNVEHRDRWVDRLSEYLDDDLSPRERNAIEEHLAACADCAAALDGLRHVVVKGRSLNRSAEPSRDLWPAVAGRLTSRGPNTAASWRSLRAGWLRPRLAAAAVVAIACLAIVWLLYPRSEPTVRQATTGSSSFPVAVSEIEHEYEKTVANLHRQARAHLTLDPHLVEVLDENLATLDAAIATYREALAEEPGDSQLRSRLDAARHRKLEVLQQAVTLATEGSE